MLIHTAQQFVLLLPVQFDFFTQPEIKAAVEVFLHQEQSFVRIVRGSQSGDGHIAIFVADGLKPFMNGGKKLRHRFRFVQARPLFKCMETQTAFVAQPAFVHFDIAAANRSINFAIGCSVARDAATGGSG